jgi:uncharacterized membrane protein YdbT with pleckstrin-like domain
MGYLSKVLQPGEQVLKVGKLHWIIYQNAVVAFVLSVLVFLILGNSPGLSLGAAIALASAGVSLLIASIVMAMEAWFNQWITEIAVTDQRVIYKRGFIWRYTAEMNMGKIESVTVTQSILGRILDYGSIHVRGTGEGIEHLHRISAPLALRNCITST